MSLGSRADIQVPMRKISQSETPTDMGGEENPQYLFMTHPVHIQTQMLKSIYVKGSPHSAKNG